MLFLAWSYIITARRYGSAAYAVFVRPSVRFQKLGNFPLEFFSHTADLANFATARRLCCQQLVVVVVDGRAC